MTGLDERLATGDIDALVVAGGNAALADTVQLLVADPYPLLESYHAATDVFPHQHAARDAGGVVGGAPRAGWRRLQGDG